MTDQSREKLKQGVVELEEGQRWRYVMREREGSPREFSFDGGETYDVSSHKAFVAAKASGKLVPEEPTGISGRLPDESAAVALEVITRIRSLSPGEELRIVHQGDRFAIVKQKVVGWFRLSALEALGIDPPDDDEEAPRADVPR